MGLVNQPTGNRSSILYAHTFQPASAPLSRVQFVETEQGPNGRRRAKSVLPFVKWGDTIYIGAPEGTEIGFQVWNGYTARIAVPAYCEGLADHVNGASEPEARTPADMWEIQPGAVGLVSGFYDPATRQLRPWQIVRGGSGYGSGEATFQTKAMNGLIDVYLRHEWVGGGRRVPIRPSAANQGQSYGVPESLGAPASKAPRPTTLSDEPAVLSGSGTSDRSGVGQGHAAIGASAAEAGGHFDTGAVYRAEVATLIQVNFELDHELNAFLAARLGPMWRWVIPVAPGNWWEPAFSWLPASGGVAPQIPVAPTPHRRRS